MSNASDHPRKALGRGITTLLPSKSAQPAQTVPSTGPFEVAIDLIDPNPLQPRHLFRAERLQELADSIRANGIIQPLIVRKAGERYQLIAGERRWRAAKLAGLNKVPTVVQNFAEDRLLEITLIENIQREDLNPIEVAEAFHRLHKQHGLSHEDIAARTGKDRTSITNMLRLLKLPKELQLLVAEQRLSMGHARAILGLPTPELQTQTAEKAISQGMSVRQVERLVQRLLEPREAPQPSEAPPDPNVKAAIDQLQEHLSTKVRIQTKDNQVGRIEIDFYSMDDLDRLFRLILQQN